MTKIAGQKPVDHQGAQGDRGLQDPRRLSDRLHGDAAPGADVRVPRPPGDRSRCRACATSAASRDARFDGRGNYNMGVKEQIIFPEIEYDKIDAIRGHEHHDHDDREDRRRSEGAARRVQVSVQELRTRHGETGTDQPPTQAREARREVREEARGARSDRRTTRGCPTRTATRRGSSCRRCRATRTRRGCATAARITGRPRGVYSKFGLGRNKLREYAMRGEDPRHRQGQLVGAR